MRSRLVSLLMAGLWVFAEHAGAEMRVGAIDTSRLLREAPQTHAALLKIEQEQAPRRRNIVVLQEELRRKMDTLQRDSAIMSVDSRVALEREIREQDRALKRERDLFDEWLSLRRYEDLSQLQSELMRDAREIAGRAGYDLVLPNPLYASPSADVTELVLEALKARDATMSAEPTQSRRSRGPLLEQRARVR